MRSQAQVWIIEPHPYSVFIFCTKKKIHQPATSSVLLHSIYNEYIIYNLFFQFKYNNFSLHFVHIRTYENAALWVCISFHNLISFHFSSLFPLAWRLRGMKMHAIDHFYPMLHMMHEITINITKLLIKSIIHTGNAQRKQNKKLDWMENNVIAAFGDPYRYIVDHTVCTYAVWQLQMVALYIRHWWRFFYFFIPAWNILDHCFTINLQFFHFINRFRAEKTCEMQCFCRIINQSSRRRIRKFSCIPHSNRRIDFGIDFYVYSNQINELATVLPIFPFRFVCNDFFMEQKNDFRRRMIFTK